MLPSRSRPAGAWISVFPYSARRVANFRDALGAACRPAFAIATIRFSANEPRKAAGDR